MRKFTLFFVLVLALSLVVVTLANAQGGSRFDREELRSGGAIEPDLTAVVRSGPISFGPLVGPNVQVNAPQQPLPDGLLGRSETTIAGITRGARLVAGWNDADGFCGPPFGAPCTPPPVPGLSGYAYSADGGLTWTDGGAPPVFDGAITRGDPWLDTGGANKTTFFYANLAVNEDDAGARGVMVHRGRFLAKDFVWYDAAIFDSPRNAVTPDSDFYDKEALAAAKNGSGAVYVSVTNFQEICGIPQFGFGQIEVWRSHDSGATWQGPAIAGPEAPDSVASCANEGTLQQSSVPAVGPHGEVYVVWQYGPFFAADGSTSGTADIVVARSLDGGVTFDPPVTVATINSMREDPPVAYNRSRINDHPRITVDAKGRVYVTFYSAESKVTGVDPTQQVLVSSQVYLSYSDNRGLSWSKPKAVAPPVPPEGVKRFWPVVTINSKGAVDVVYYESLETQATPDPNDVECSVSIGSGLFRTGPNSSLIDTYWVQSRNRGRSFGAPVRMTTETTNWCNVVSNIRPNMGDYIGATPGGPRVFAAWADGRNGVPDTFYAAGEYK